MSSSYKKSIKQGALQIASATLLSRVFAVPRVILLGRYFGAGVLGDAFTIAFRIPNSLRKVFAEGALSPAMVPTFVNVIKNQSRSQVDKLMTLSFLVFESVLLVLCALAMYFAADVIHFMAPGFSAEQTGHAIPMLKILMPFIFFISSSALLAGALQAVGHFFVPAFSPILLNIVFVISLIVCIAFSVPVNYFCYTILFGGFLQLVAHVMVYFKYGFSFKMFDAQARENFKQVMVKFLPMLFSAGLLEVNMIVDTMFASFLPAGSTALLQYGSDFMRIPLGVIAVSFSTTLLPYFSRISLFAPKRLSYYLLESSKFIWWLNLPIIFIMCFFSEKIFHTLFLSEKFSLAQVEQAGIILIAYLLGLLFYSLNKIILNIFYALHDARTPTVVSVFSVGLNVLLNWIFVTTLGAVGLALATSVAAAVQTGLMLYLLHTRKKFKLYAAPFLQFVVRYTGQLAFVMALFVVVYYLAAYCIAQLPATYAHFFLYQIGFWFWAGPLACCALGLLWILRKRFNLGLHFLD